MMLGLSLSAFTTLHVVISLIAIVAGLIVMFGMLGSQRMPALTGLFLLFTILTNVPGLMFPFEKLTLVTVALMPLIVRSPACTELGSTAWFQFTSKVRVPGPLKVPPTGGLVVVTISGVTA